MLYQALKDAIAADEIGEVMQVVAAFGGFLIATCILFLHSYIARLCQPRHPSDPQEGAGRRHGARPRYLLGPAGAARVRGRGAAAGGQRRRSLELETNIREDESFTARRRPLLRP